MSFLKRCVLAALCVVMLGSLSACGCGPLGLNFCGGPWGGPGGYGGGPGGGPGGGYGPGGGGWHGGGGGGWGQ